jgi:hypothetical protein
MYIYFILFISFLFPGPDKEPDWKLRKQKSGIEVYTRFVEGSLFDEFKGLVTLKNTSVNEVLDVILNVENYTNLYPDCINAKMLEQKKKYHDIYYFSIKAPWPVKNRDSVYESVTKISEDKKYARIVLKPLGNYIEEKKGFVRMYNGNGFWELEETEDNTIQITYQFLSDPGGKVPAWLSNSMVVSSPFQTLINLRDILNE